MRPLLAGVARRPDPARRGCGGDDDDAVDGDASRGSTTDASAARRPRPPAPDAPAATTGDTAADRHDRRRREPAGERAAAHRVAVGDAHRDAVRHRRRRPGDRRRRPVELPGRGGGGDDRPVRLHAERRGDRRLRPRPRRDVRRRRADRAARGARHRRCGCGESAATFDDAYDQIEQLGAATGHVGEAAELVGQMQTDLDGAGRRPADLGDAADRTSTSSTPRLQRHVATRSSGRCTRCSGSRTSPTPPTTAPATRS